ncbi:wax ester synthase/diacylglycerol acyltransferase 11-like isoform X1 [Alnus glutinosa]|uniref:wax ester synthase/diacylglycerol acyltransferase 11-like isoform X1 n=2 Tax=Alnus glutinosa TaxID=3517 RepID=UPI002D79BBE2|nr:wax ester synthase/diacylglycerol acyltransferase 11-like isoform X1 [Alnus glutinosa]
MESEEGLCRSRKQAMKPIRTKTANEEDGEDHHHLKKHDDEVFEEEPLSPSARLFHEPNFNVYIIAIMGSKTKIQVDIVKANLEHTLLKHPRFSSLQVVDDTGDMKWVRTKVDLEKHIIVPELNPDMESGDQFVEDYVFNLSKTTIDKSQPLWDLHLLNAKTSDSEAVGVFRIHHSLGDGTSLISLLLACTRKISDPEALPTVPVKKKKKQEKSSSWWLWRCFVGFWWVWQLLWHTVVDVFMFMLTASFLKDTETPLKGPDRTESSPRRIIHRTVSLDDLKLVKNAMNTTINDVALGVTQAGLSRYLNRKYGQGKKAEEATETKNFLPKKIRLRSTLLINIRTSVGIEALADMMENDTQVKWGNWIGYVLLPFTIGLRDDPLDYVREAKATIDRKKHSFEAIYTFSIAELVLKLFGIKRASGMSHRIITHTTMCFSNLVGPLEEIGFYGHPMTYLAPSSYGQPHALMINFQSYVNKMTIVLSIDESIIPDAYQLCDDIVDSLKLIKDAVIAKGLIKEDQNRN